MLLAVLKQGDVGYKITYLLHILTAVAAYGAAIVMARLGSHAKNAGGPTALSISDFNAKLVQQLQVPALVLSGLFGIGLITMSDEIYGMGQSWVSIAFLLWFGLIGVSFFGLLPAQKLMATSPGPEAGKKIGMFTGISHLLYALMVIVMVFKPGL